MESTLQPFLLVPSFFVTPVYLLVWLIRRRDRLFQNRARVLWSFCACTAAWVVMTWFALIEPVAGCMGGHCHPDVIKDLVLPAFYFGVCALIVLFTQNW